MIIKNFKNYFGEVEFDLSKEIIVVYGQNGFGKSTFFEAIEWCLTGKINKFTGLENELKKDIINKVDQEKDKEISVVLYFDNKKIERKFQFIDKSIRSTSVVLTVNNKEKISGKDNVENYLKKHLNPINTNAKEKFNDYLKQSNILSQQQINDFITSDSSKERFIALGNIMGLKSELIEFRNYKKILNYLENQHKSTSNILLNVKQQISDKVSNMKFIEENRTNKNIKVLFNHFIAESLYEEMIDNEITSRLMNIEKRKNIINEVEKLDTEDKQKSFKSLKSNLEIHIKNTDVELNRLNRLHIIKSRLENKVLGLKGNKNNLDSINSLKEKMILNKKNLEKLSSDVKNIEELNKKKTEITKKISVVKYNIVYKSYLNENLNKQFNNKLMILAEKNKVNDLQIKLDKTIAIKEKINKEIFNNKEELLGNLISGIKDIKKYTEQFNDDICPVCTNKVSNLEQVISSQLKKYVFNLDTKTSRYEKLLSSQKYCNQRIVKIENLIKKKKSDIEKNNTSIKEYEAECEKYESSVYFNETLKITSLETMYAQLEKLNSKVNDYKTILDLLLDQELISNELSAFENVGFNKSKIKNSIDVQTELEICLNRIKLLNQKIIQKNANYLNLTELNSTRLEQLNNLENQLSGLENFLDVLSDKADFNNLIFKLQKNIADTENEILDYKTVKRLLINYHFNDSVKNQIKDLEKNERELVSINKRYNERIKMMINQKEIKQKFLGEGISGQLNQNKSTVQKIFRYLDPLPSNSKLIFDGEEEKINIKIAFDRNENNSLFNISEAKNVLSSGQLNVLAISIFLAINNDQKIHSFDFVGIDDPIQNMDDINQYTICDVLNNIKKQLIISTHDYNFLQLFYKKNKHRKNEMIIYNLTSPYLSKEKVDTLTFKSNIPYFN